MRSIGLYEISTHEHILEYFCKIAAASGAAVTVFTSSEIARQLRENVDETKVEIVEKGTDESTGSFLSRVESRSTDLDLLMVNSVFGGYEDMFHYSRFSSECPVLLWIYNLKLWFRGFPALTGGIRRNMLLAARRRLLSHVDAINVEYGPMKQWLEQNEQVGKPVYNLLPTLYEGANQKTAEDKTTITVPGYVSSERRDYRLVMSVFERLFERYDGLALHLLGGPDGEYGHRILDRCASLEQRGHDVTYHEEYVPMNQYHHAIQESNVLLCPLRQKIEILGSTERYGVTKGSGNVFDGIRNATPMVLPSHFQRSEELEEMTVAYDSAKSLERRIESLVEEPSTLESLSADARTLACRYDLEHQAERFDTVVSEMT